MPHKCIKCKVADTATAVCDACVLKHAVPLPPDQLKVVRDRVVADIASGQLSEVYYLFHDGEVWSTEQMRGQFSGLAERDAPGDLVRMASLNLIALKGIPRMVSARFVRLASAAASDLAIASQSVSHEAK